MCLCEGASALQRAGRWREAAALIDQARRFEVPGTSEIFIQERLALLDVAQGRHADAAQRLALLRHRTGRSVEAQWIAPAAEAEAELALWDGRPLEARDVIGAALGRLDVHAPGYVSRTGPLFALGVRAEADAAELARARRVDGDVRESKAIAERYLGTMRAIRDVIVRGMPNFASQAEAYRLICEAECSRLDGASDPRAWAAAADAFGAIPMAYAQAYALWRQAEAVLASAATRSAAADPLRDAHAIAIDLAAAPLRLEIERLAQRGRLDLVVESPVPDPTPDLLASLGLTPREREVLDLIATGRTNHQIATELFITDKTAGHHVSNILAKLGVHGRTEAAAIAHRLSVSSPMR